MTNVCILDYGSGNVKSVFNLLKYLNIKSIISNNPEKIKKSTHIILPGVGSFGKSMAKIKKKLPIKILEKEVLNKKKPFLGICVGMQILADHGEEFGNHKGLGWIPGKVKKLQSKILPHIGWNEINIKKKNKILEDLIDKNFYFVNSYHFEVNDKSLVCAETTYGKKFCSVVCKDNIIGVQFHPEKSQIAGKSLIKNFIRL